MPPVTGDGGGQLNRLQRALARLRNEAGARLGGLLIGLLMAGVAVALGTVGLELAFGVVNRSATRRPLDHPFGEMAVFTRYHPILGWDGVPNRTDELLGKTVTLNSLGNRGPEVALAKPPGTRRVVVLGDSQAWGLGVGDDETIAAQLEARLNADSGQHWQALNLGVSGYGTDQAYLKYLLQGERYAPDAVVEVVFYNDLGENAATRAWRVEKPRFYFKGDLLCLGNLPPTEAAGWPESALLPEDGVRLWGHQVELGWSQTYRFFQTRAWRFQRQPQPDPADWARVQAEVPCVANREKYPGKGAEIMLALLRRLDARARARGARLVTVFVPVPLEVYETRDVSYYAAVQAQLANWGLASIDLRRCALAAGVTADELFLPENHHLSAAGSALAAQALAEALR